MFKPYRNKKIYVSDNIFEKATDEIKIGYFNMNGFLKSNHLDNDLNLLNLEFLVLSETWLTEKTHNKELFNKLHNWKILKRLDATDNRKHMGLMLLTPVKNINYSNLLFDLDYIEGNEERTSQLLYQGLTMKLKKYYKTLVFLYIRRTPSESESVRISERFQDFDCIIGDLNLTLQY